MKSIVVCAHMYDETKRDCTVSFARAAYYDVGMLKNGKTKVTVSKQGQGFATPITLRIKASERCARAYSMRDFCDLAESIIEEKGGSAKTERKTAASRENGDAYLVFTKLGHLLGEIGAETLQDALKTAQDYYGIRAYSVEKI